VGAVGPLLHVDDEGWASAEADDCAGAWLLLKAEPARGKDYSGAVAEFIGVVEGGQARSVLASTRQVRLRRNPYGSLVGRVAVRPDAAADVAEAAADRPVLR
jgi:hypothetical protein